MAGSYLATSQPRTVTVDAPRLSQGNGSLPLCTLPGESPSSLLPLPTHNPLHLSYSLSLCSQTRNLLVLTNVCSDHYFYLRAEVDMCVKIQRTGNYHYVYTFVCVRARERACSIKKKSSFPDSLFLIDKFFLRQKIIKNITN